MIKTITILFLSALFSGLLSQQTIYEEIMHDGLTREYILYVPDSYTGSEAVPIVFNFHGFTGSAAGQMGYGDFRAIADTAGFLVVHPQGTLFNGNTHWNVGGWTVGSTVDDVGFTSALIDSLLAEYNIDQSRIYSTGFSNGGYMSFLLACQLGDRIAAIASVAGSMTPETYDDCSPTHPTAIMQFHGTWDFVVPYDGAAWTHPIEEAIDYWVDFNNCNDEAAITQIEDIDPLDGSTVEHIVYHNGDNDVNTEHFKILSGGHTWPGNSFGGAGTNYDIDASQEIWAFFSQYDIHGAINPTGIEDLISNIPDEFHLDQNYPNPFNPSTMIRYHLAVPGSVHLKVYDINGKLVRQLVSSSPMAAGTYEVEWDGTDELGQQVTSGRYIYRLTAGSFSQTRTLTLVR